MGMPSPTGINIRFDYDDERDLYVVYPVCTLINEDDCRAWTQAYENFFAPLGRRVDCIFVLDMFTVSPVISAVWQRYRTQVHARYTRHTMRVYLGSDALKVIGGASHQECAGSIEAAVAMIEKFRATQQP